MVVVKEQTSSMQFRLVTGQDEEGNLKLSTRTIGRVKSDVEDEDIYAIGSEIMSLQENQLASFYRLDRKELVGE